LAEAVFCLDFGVKDLFATVHDIAAFAEIPDALEKPGILIKTRKKNTRKRN
jgi:hypothetical protein